VVRSCEHGDEPLGFGATELEACTWLIGTGTSKFLYTIKVVI
jgi:hypothetical protein